MNIVQKPTPNFAQGRSGYRAEIIVIHIMDGTLAGTDSWFANPGSQVSAHYGVGRAGEVHQYVGEENVAWHAGRVVRPSFALYKPGINPNLYTVGIEHEGKADSVWTDIQKRTSADLIKGISVRNGIPLDRDHVIGHYQVFADKPNCPAIDKSIIDQLITLAHSSTPSIEEAITNIESGLNILKGLG